jgi:hypothetical protein
VVVVLVLQLLQVQGSGRFLPWVRFKLTRAGEIEAGLNANLEAEEQSHGDAYTD